MKFIQSIKAVKTQVVAVSVDCFVLHFFGVYMAEYSCKTLCAIKNGWCLSCYGTGFVGGFDFEEGDYKFPCIICDGSGMHKYDDEIKENACLAIFSLTEEKI